MSEAQLGPSADKQSQDEQRRDERALQELKVSNMRKVMQTPEGRAVLVGILELCGLQHGSINATFNESYVFFREGQRDIGGNLTNWMVEASIDDYLAIQREQLRGIELNRLTKGRDRGVKA